jgi:hypothetical protein
MEDGGWKFEVQSMTSILYPPFSILHHLTTDLGFHRSGLLLSCSRTPQVNDQSIEKIPEDLISGFHILRMTFFAENGAQFTFCNFKIYKAKDLDDIIIPQVERYTQLF